MSLEFKGAPDWLLQEYMNRKSPGQLASEGIQQGLNTYVQAKAMERQQQADALSSYIKAFEAGGPKLAQDVATRTGLKNPPVLPGAQPAQAPVSPVVLADGGAQALTEQSAQQSLPPVNQSPLIDHWNSLQAPAQTQAQAPAQSSIPGLPNDFMQQFDSFSDQGRYGDRQRNNLMASVSMAKSLKDLNKGGEKTPYTKKQVLEKGSFDPEKEMIVDQSDQSNAETRGERLTSSLRQNLLSSDPYKNLNTLRATTTNIANAVKNPGAYGDLGVLFDYMKTLDPTSVVREGEQQSFRATGSFTNRMANTMTKIVSGESVTPEQRNEVLKYVNMRLKTANDIYRNHADPILKQAKRLNIDPTEIDPYYGQQIDDFNGQGKEGPKQGDVDGGYKFMGGDPGDPKNWKEVNQ